MPIHLLGPAAIAAILLGCVLGAVLAHRRGVRAKLGATVGLLLVALGAYVAWQIYKPVDAVAADPGRVPDVAVGERYIDFTATDANGGSFTLSSLEGDPILLKFFRGHW